MAPRPPDMLDDEEAWLDEVEAYYKKRGISWERSPKVAGRPIDLQKLYKIVMQHGGYDALSAERMQWRSLVKHFGFGSQHEAAMTFQLKTAYFKNLAAYEISTYWGEEPPPPEILEHITAKGGDLRKRTLENYPIPSSRESGNMNDGLDSGDEEQKTPSKIDAMDVDETGSASRYPIRQLRQDPKRTQMYQPDLTTSRQRYARTTSSPQASPIPQTYNNASANPMNPSFSLDKYEPRQPITMSLRPVVTPGNNPAAFYHQKALEKAKTIPRPPPEPQQFLRHSIPNNMSGPNIYLRCLYGLRSGLPHEQDFALHHLVKVSYERGDKYKFEGFPLLAESLLEKALEISQLVHGFKWEVTYDPPNETHTIHTLNAAFGTADLLKKLESFTVADGATGPGSADFMQKLDKLNEAALVIRNMVILEENASFLSKFKLFRDFLIITCNLPHLPQLTEYRQYALEMAEQVTRYWDMLPDDPLYLTLLTYLESDDRGAIISASRALYRIGMDTIITHQLTNIKLSTVERMIAFMLLDDDELVSVALDFLYKFTASLDNVKFVLSANADILAHSIPRLVTLLLHNAKFTEEKIQVSPAQASPKNTAIPAISADLHQQLLQFPEPERSSRWLKCCFEESPQDDITQIAIWQAYQGRFQNAIPAAEFIKNVSNTFATAQAQVINGPTPRFIIKGIRPRRTLVDLNDKMQIKCQWEVARSDMYNQPGRLDGQHLCKQWLSSRENLWSHMLIDHLGIQPNEQGKFPHDTQGTYQCRWATCMRQSPLSNSWEAGCHVKIHVPESAEAAAKIAEGVVKEADFITHKVCYTPADGKEPAGIPGTSVFIMRNLARFALRRGQDFTSTGVEGVKVSLMDRFYGHVRPGLFHALCTNKTLSWYLTDLIKMIEKGQSVGAEQKKEAAEHDDGNA